MFSDDILAPVSFSDVIPSWLWDSCSLCVALSRFDGHVIQSNQGFCDLGLVAGMETAKFVAPDFSRFVAAQPRQGGGVIYQGTIEFEGAQGRGSISGKVYYQGDAFLVVAEWAQERLSLLQSEIDRLARRLDETTRKDALTGLANRKHLDDRTDEEILRWHRYHHPLSIVLIDLDDFGVINDDYGRQVADEVLQHIATLLGQSIRSLDLAARYGGGEFALLLPETNTMGGLIVGERLRLELESQIILPLVQPVTASFGIAALFAGERRDSLFRRAAQAVRQSKRKGKNCVTMTTGGQDSSTG